MRYFTKRPWCQALVAVLLVVALVVLPVRAQTAGAHPSAFQNTYQTVPGAMPTSLTCLVGISSSCQVVLNPALSSYTDPYVCYADMTATGQTVTIQDGQSSPVVWLSNTLGTGGSSTTWTWTASSDSLCRRMPNGVYVQAGGSGVTYYMIIKYGNKAF